MDPACAGSVLAAAARHLAERAARRVRGRARFPLAMVVEFLLRHYARTGAEGALQMAADTCTAMARGGIYDQLGGGFARYSVDREWIVPHFEKMLYDNALLCRAYAHLWRATGSATRPAGSRWRPPTSWSANWRNRRRAASPPRWTPTADDGTGRHVEGAYYVWTPAAAHRGRSAPRTPRCAAHYFGVTEQGTFEEGASVLRLPGNAGPVDAARVAGVRARLLAARDERPRPGRDDKVVAAWNGLAIAALAETGAYFDRPDLVERATEAADLLVRVHLGEVARLNRTSKDGRAGDNAGVLEDYGDVAEGFLALAAVTEGAWLEFAGFLLDMCWSSSPGGRRCTTPPMTPSSYPAAPGPDRQRHPVRVDGRRGGAALRRVHRVRGPPHRRRGRARRGEGAGPARPPVRRLGPRRGREIPT
ncbi:hypothetical protein SBADM41S_11568 [Streptomyces badius]